MKIHAEIFRAGSEKSINIFSDPWVEQYALHINMYVQIAITPPSSTSLPFSSIFSFTDKFLYGFLQKKLFSGTVRSFCRSFVY